MAWQFVGVGQFQFPPLSPGQISEPQFSFFFRGLQGKDHESTSDMELFTANSILVKKSFPSTKKILPKLSSDLHRRRAESLIHHKERMTRSKVAVILPPIPKTKLRTKAAFQSLKLSCSKVLPGIPVQTEKEDEGTLTEAPETFAKEKFMESARYQMLVEDNPVLGEEATRANNPQHMQTLYVPLFHGDTHFPHGRFEISQISPIARSEQCLENLRKNDAHFGGQPWATRLQRRQSEPLLHPASQDIWSAEDLDSMPASDPGPSRQAVRRLKQHKSVDNLTVPDQERNPPTPLKIPINLRNYGNGYTPPDAPIIFVLGGPGSGKISHCEQLTSVSEGMVHINMLSSLGIVAHELTSDNQYDATNVPAYKALEVLVNRLSGSPFANCYIVSGYPRHMRDAVEYLSKMQRIDGVVILDWSVKSLERQVQLGAQLKEIDVRLARKDLANYRTHVIPVAEFFDQQGLLHIVAGERPPQEVFEDLVEEIRGILAYPPGAFLQPTLNIDTASETKASLITGYKFNEHRGSSSAPLSLRDQIQSLSQKYGGGTAVPLTKSVDAMVQIHQSENESDPRQKKDIAGRRQSFDSVDILINEELKQNHIGTAPLPKPIIEEDALPDTQDAELYPKHQAGSQKGYGMLKPDEVALEKDIENIINMVQADALLEVARNKSKKAA